MVYSVNFTPSGGSIFSKKVFTKNRKTEKQKLKDQRNALFFYSLEFSSQALVKFD